MRISRALSLPLGLYLCHASGTALPSGPPRGALVIYEAFENAAYSLRIETDGSAEYAAWSSGRVRERCRGPISAGQVRAWLDRLNDLPSLDPPGGAQDLTTSAVWEVDRFVIVSDSRKHSGSIRQAPTAYAELISDAMEFGRSLDGQPADGIYLLAESAGPSATSGGEAFSTTDRNVRDAIAKALFYPFSPVIIHGFCAVPPAFDPDGELVPGGLRLKVLFSTGCP